MRDLSEYDIVINYTPGRENLAADALSRMNRPTQDEDEETLFQLPEGLVVDTEVPGGGDSILMSLYLALSLIHI